MMTHIGWTALMIASMNGHDIVVSLLIEKGADINFQDNEGESTLIK